MVEFAAATVVAHYRLRPPQLTTTLPVIGDNATVATGASTEASERLRALYVIGGDGAEAVSRLAEHLPAVRAGGIVELWPVIEPEHGEASSRSG